MTFPIPTRWTPYLLSVLRIVVAFLFMQHGTQKLFALPAAGPGGSVALTSLAGLAGVLETFGGALLLVGLLTRPVAFLLAGEMAVAYFLRAAPQGFWPILNRGETATLFCFVWLYLAAAGAGPWSLDALWQRFVATRDQQAARRRAEPANQRPALDRPGYAAMRRQRELAE